MTLQGRAMKEATVKFGDGCTLPFTPCKKGYVPTVNGDKRYACSLHHKDRLRRLTKAGGKLRKGEMDLEYFWNKELCFGVHDHDGEHENSNAKASTH